MPKKDVEKSPQQIAHEREKARCQAAMAHFDAIDKMTDEEYAAYRQGEVFRTRTFRKN